MDPLISSLPAYRRRSPAEMDRLDAQRSAVFDATVDAMRGITESPAYRRASASDGLQFLPGRGYVPVRDLAAELAMSQGVSLGPAASELDYETTGLGRALNALDAVGSAAEGVLAGLSSDTERSGGFVDPVMQGMSRFADPDADMSAVQERLYRNRDGSPMAGATRFAAGEVLSPWQWMAPPAMRRPSGIRTELVDRNGDVIRRLRDATSAPRLGLPAPVR